MNTFSSFYHYSSDFFAMVLYTHLDGTKTYIFKN